MYQYFIDLRPVSRLVRQQDHIASISEAISPWRVSLSGRATLRAVTGHQRAINHHWHSSPPPSKVVASATNNATPCFHGSEENCLLLSRTTEHLPFGFIFPPLVGNSTGRRLDVSRSVSLTKRDPPSMVPNITMR